MKEMPSLIDEFKNKLKVREEAEKEAMRQQADLLDEARDYFGYAIEGIMDFLVCFGSLRVLRKLGFCFCSMWFVVKAWLLLLVGQVGLNGVND